jgi:nucleotidyltransferase substrate binding protein (TIGR01987 family)
VNTPALDLGALRAAVASFEDSLDVVGNADWFDAQSPRVQNTLMAGVIQNFEFVFEIGFKMIRRRLELDSASPNEIDELNFRDVLRVAGERGLVDDVPAWFEYRRMRNITAHTYDQEKARQIYLGALKFRGDATKLLARLEAREERATVAAPMTMANTMNRIAIIGCSGAGKSTLARAVGARLGLPVVHLDALFWKPGWVESDQESFRAAVDQALAGQRWVSDGNFTSVADIRFSRADTIVWIDPPITLCLWRAIRRAVTDFGRTRADLAPGCLEKIDFAFYGYILGWNRVTRPRVHGAIDAFGSHASLVMLRSDREVAAWMS